MIFSRFFRRHYAITALILFACLAVGHFSNLAYIRYNQKEESTRRPPLYFARLLDVMNRQDRRRAIEDLRAIEDDGFPFRFQLLDAKGELLAPLSDPENFGGDSVTLPEKPYDSVGVGPRREVSIIRLPGEPPQYLSIRGKPHMGPRGPGPGNPPPLPGIMGPSLGILVLSLLLGVGISLLLMFRFAQAQAKIADGVIAELRSGNLKARFPIRRRDEIGEAMGRFNSMADEIERLVDQLRESERSRMNLLQELAHDLRTPIASLKSLLETLQSNSENLSASIRAELFLLALRETDYFERLVEDLLTLARVIEPSYQTKAEDVRLSHLIEEEIESVDTHYREKSLQIITDLPEQTLLRGDRRLLRRLLRNALENAYSFATSEVRVRVRDLGSEIEIFITDDGPGMTPEILSAFGERRLTRVLGEETAGRISVGLGSVIMKTVTRVHRGSLRVENSPGASLTFRFPKV